MIPQAVFFIIVKISKYANDHKKKNKTTLFDFSVKSRFFFLAKETSDRLQLNSKAISLPIYPGKHELWIWKGASSTTRPISPWPHWSW